MIRAGSLGRKYTIRKEIDDDFEEYDVPGDIDWDEKGRNRISHIYVSFDEIIRSIQFGYLENGALVMSEKYGSSSEGLNFRVVRLDENEYVTGLSGSVGMFGGIINLTFYTNRRKHGPIGHDDVEGCSKIEIDPAIRDRREFGGFFGSYYCLGALTSIGIYVSPVAKFP